MKYTITKCSILASAAYLTGCSFFSRQEEYLRDLEHMSYGTMQPIPLDVPYSTAPMQTIPFNDEVIYGVLDNGLTYYIVQTDEKHYKNQAKFCLVQKTGSMVEEDNELGMAHLVEHLVFTNTQHFPGERIVNFASSIGVAYGEESNATTSFDYTEYHLDNVPLDNKANIDTCLLILHDWAAASLMPDYMVERERSIVLEEYRTRSVGGFNQRYNDPREGTRYAKRLPIGDPELIKKFTPEQLRNFYSKWYQPQNQAVIIYGDINKNDIEQKVKALFSPIKRGTTLLPQFDEHPLQHDTPRILIYKSNTAQQAEIRYTFSTANDSLALHRGTLAWAVEKRALDIIEMIMLDRLTRINTETSVFSSNPVSDNNRDMHHDYPLTIVTTTPSPCWKNAMTAFIQELERMRKYGWTVREANQFNTYGNAPMTDTIDFNQSIHKFEDTFFSNTTGYLQHFIWGQYMANPNSNELLISYEHHHCSTGWGFSRFKRLTEDPNLTISIILPDNDQVNMPTVSQVEQLIADARKANLESDKFRYAEKPLYAKMMNELQFDSLPGGTIVSEKDIDIDHCTELLLSNGVRCIVVDKTSNTWQNVNCYLMGHPGNYDNLTAKKIKMLQSMKNDPFVGMNSNDYPKSSLSYEDFSDIYKSEGIGRMPIEDLLKLAYYRLTNCTIDTARYEFCIQKALAEAHPVSTDLSNLDLLFNRLILNDSYTDRSAPLTVDEIKAITIDEMNALLKEYVSNFNGATFVLASGEGMRTLRPLIAKYLGSLPSKPEKINATDIDAFHFKSKDDYAKYTYKSDFSRADILYGITQDANDGYQYSQEKHIMSEALRSVISQSLHDNVRLAEGNVYSFYIGNTIFIKQTPRHMIHIYTPCDPKNIDGMMTQIDNIIEQMAHGDLLKDSYVENYISNRLKTLESLDTNSASHIFTLACDYAFTDEIVSNTNNSKIIRSLTADKLRSYLSEILEKGSKKRLVITTE